MLGLPHPVSPIAIAAASAVEAVRLINTRRVVDDGFMILWILGFCFRVKGLYRPHAAWFCFLFLWLGERV